MPSLKIKSRRPPDPWCRQHHVMVTCLRLFSKPTNDSVECSRAREPALDSSSSPSATLEEISGPCSHFTLHHKSPAEDRLSSLEIVVKKVSTAYLGNSTMNRPIQIESHSEKRSLGLTVTHHSWEIFTAMELLDEKSGPRCHAFFDGPMAAGMGFPAKFDRTNGSLSGFYTRVPLQDAFQKDTMRKEHGHE